MYKRQVFIRQQTDQLKLRRVGILILIHHNVQKTLLIVRKHLWTGFEPVSYTHLHLVQRNLQQVTLNAVAHSIFYAPLYVATEEGYFREEGIDLTLVTGFGADKTVTAVLAGGMTSGSLWKNIFLFSIPLMCSQILEILFNLSDVAIVGKYAGYIPHIRICLKSKLRHFLKHSSPDCPYRSM